MIASSLGIYVMEASSDSSYRITITTIVTITTTTTVSIVATVPTMPRNDRIESAP